MDHLGLPPAAFCQRYCIRPGQQLTLNDNGTCPSVRLSVCYVCCILLRPIVDGLQCVGNFITTFVTYFMQYYGKTVTVSSLNFQKRLAVTPRSCR